MTVTVEDVQKVLALVKEFSTYAVIFVPEGKAKEYVVKAQAVLTTPALSAVVVDAFKLYDEVKAIVVK